MHRFYLKLSQGIWLKKQKTIAQHLDTVTHGSEADLLTVVDACGSIFVIVGV